VTDEHEQRPDPDEEARAQAEADLVAIRIEELHEKPIQGNFDAAHLKAVHAYIFQDLPDHEPGVTRGDTDDWTKRRVLEGASAGHDVYYASEGIEQRIADILDGFGGPKSLEGLSNDDAARRLASLYGDLDHAHAFYEGNSRTLREFTRELADEAGYALDWTGTSVGRTERNALYVARDIAVLERAFPDLTPRRAMETENRNEYEASFVLEALRRHAGDNSLAAIIRSGLERAPARERESEPQTSHDPKSDSALWVVTDAATGAAEKLADFVFWLLGNRAANAQNVSPSVAEQRRALAALERMSEAMERGERLSASDITHLTPTHLENIKRHGDSYILSVIASMERQRDRDYGYGRERERDYGRERER
jgi:fido (protein-threonine AMPylation protein)